MKKILMISQLPSIAFKRQKLLQKYFPKVEITTCCNEQEAMWVALSEEFDLGIFQLSHIDSEDGHFGELIRVSGFDFPMIVSGPVLGSRKFFESLPKRSNTVLLREPLKDKELICVVRKLLATGSINQPVHPRYPTDEIVLVEKYGAKKGLTSTVVDISLGGAQLEFEEKSSFQMGDFLRLKFNYKDAARARKVNAQVMWTRFDDQSKKAYLGLAFVR